MFTGSSCTLLLVVVVSNPFTFIFVFSLYGDVWVILPNVNSLFCLLFLLLLLLLFKTVPNLFNLTTHNDHLYIFSLRRYC